MDTMTAADVAMTLRQWTGLAVEPQDVDEPEPGFFEVDGMPWDQWGEAMGSE